MGIHLVHTAHSHCDRFDRLRDEIAPDLHLTHHVHEAWLRRASQGSDAGLQAEILASLRSLDGPILCTCSTIGPIAEKAGATRIDWPMMQAAARVGGGVLMVYCLESTVLPSLTLLQKAMDETDIRSEITCLDLSAHWPLFETGELDRFVQALARDIKQTLRQLPDIAAVVLAQGSMAKSADHLRDLKVPVLSSPRLALETMIAQRGGKAS